MVAPSKSGMSWLFRNTTPHMKAVNHRPVKRFGVYLRMTMGWGTGSRPTMVVLVRKDMMVASSIAPSDRRTSSSIWGTKCCSNRRMVVKGSSFFTAASHELLGTKRNCDGALGLSPAPPKDDNAAAPPSPSDDDKGCSALTLPTASCADPSSCVSVVSTTFVLSVGTPPPPPPPLPPPSSSCRRKRRSIPPPFPAAEAGGFGAGAVREVVEGGSHFSSFDCSTLACSCACGSVRADRDSNAARRRTMAYTR
mmetsp:Transcript_18449/g.36475  ORF Transcript_18449/g.36475 Transcript_18449/m.36475 type:complete len:251 (-) Transcript_18449:1188-1940(-)